MGWPMVVRASRNDPILRKTHQTESRIQSAMVVMRSESAIPDATRPIVAASTDQRIFAKIT